MGLWDTICVLCGGPVTYQANIQMENGKWIKTKYVKWLGDLYIITNTEDIVKADDSRDNLSGEYKIKNKIYTILPANWYMYREIGVRNLKKYSYGIVCHQNCYKLIYKSLKHKIQFANICRLISWDGYMTPKYKYGIIKKYWGQFFNYELAVKNNEWVLKNPLSNAKNKNRILRIWRPLVKKFKKNPPRPSPCESATDFRAGTIFLGYNKKLWIVKSITRKKRWILYKGETKHLKNIPYYPSRKIMKSKKKRRSTSSKRKSKRKSKSKKKSKRKSKRKSKKIVQNN